jgi:bifunctional DNA primase/polymerase-like protein/AAA domain-containing protein
MSAATARPFAELFGGRPGDGDIASLARAAARAGYAVLPIRPRTKHPLCTLTQRQANTADKQSAQAARDAGKRNWERVRHACGKDHATTDPATAHRVFKRLAETHPDLNLAVEIHQSRVLVVDADTIEESRSFTALWAAEEREPTLENAAPTVRSPGEVGPDGQWKHSDGGHFWFLLDNDIDLGDIGRTVSIPIGLDTENQAQLKIAGYVLVPPSTRPEGEYRMASDAHIAPAWLIERVQLHLTERRVTRTHRADRCLDTDDTITLAQAAMPWSAILEPRGWSLSYKVDRCGCEIWTAPGEHASPKSGTFHDSGCGQYDTADGFGHVWTDNPPEGLGNSGLKTFSKIQFVAWSDHGGDMSSAMRELEIEYSRSEPTVLTRRDVQPPLVSSSDDSSEDPDEPDESADQGRREEDDDEPDHTSWWFRDLGPVLAGENPEPEPAVLRRGDGKYLFYPGKVNGIIGPSESGKSWIALEAVAQELRAGHAVLYLDFEDTAPGIVSRLRDLDVSDELMSPDAGLLAYVGPEEALHAIAYAEYARVLRDRPWSLIVFDGVNAAMTQDGLDLLSNTDATKFFTKVTRPASLTGATVVTIDHVPKDPEKRGKGGIGAQAKRATVTGAAVSVEVTTPFGRGRSGSVDLVVDKDRPGHVRSTTNAADLWCTALAVASEDGALRFELAVPEEVTRTSNLSQVRADEYRVKVVGYLAEIKAEVSGNTIEKSVTGTAGHIREALAWLVENGYVGRRMDPRNGRTQLHSFFKDYSPDCPTIMSSNDSDDPFRGRQ